MVIVYRINKIAGFILGGLASLLLAVALALPAGAQELGSFADIVQNSSKARLPQALLKDFEQGSSTTRVIVILDSGIRAQEARALSSEPAKESLRREAAAYQATFMAGLKGDNVRVRRSFTYIPGFAATVDQAGLTALLNNPLVASVEKDDVLVAHTAQGIPLMNATAARSQYDGSGLAVAICDTGIDYTHPLLGGSFPNDKVLGGTDTGQDDNDPMDGNGHGTACAGISAGPAGGTGDYIGGVAPGAKLYAVKISDDATGGSANESDMIAGWEWCVTHQNDNPAHPIMIISTSFGGGRYYSTCDGDSPGMTAAAANAAAAGITIFASSGNDGYCDSMGWPACISNVISVGAVYDASFGTYTPCVDAGSCTVKYTTDQCTGYYCIDSSQPDMVTSYSNSANFLTILAPSNQAHTLYPVAKGSYDAEFGGTSAACPYAAGAAAVLQSAAKAINGSFLSPAELKNVLTTTGTLVTDSKVAVTKPRVNLGAAYDYLYGGTTNLGVTPAGFAIQVEEGHNVASQAMTVTGYGGSAVGYSITDNAAWLSVSPSSGTSTGEADQVSLVFNTASLPDGDYTGAITLTSAQAVNSPLTRTVLLMVIPTLADSLGYGATSLTTGGNAPFYSQSSVHYQGTSAARSGVISNLQTSWLQTTVTGPGTLSFYWKVSSELNYDYLHFYLDGVLKDSISGEKNWENKTYTLGSGTHVLRWVYEKDYMVSDGQDAGWVDALSFTASPTPDPKAVGSVGGRNLLLLSGSSQTTVTPTPTPGATVYHAVIVGIADYEGTLNDLDYTDDDAIGVRNALLASGNWLSSNVELLLDSAASEAGVKAAVQRMAARAKSGDVCLFYYSGHGSNTGDVYPYDESDGRDEYVCPWDINTNEILDDELGTWLAALPTSKVVVMIDTCFSGGQIKSASLDGRTIKSIGPARTLQKGDGFLADIKRGIEAAAVTRDVDDLTSVYASMACDDDEYSYESSSVGHGYYTYYLLQALTSSTADTNGNGWVSGEETFTWLYSRVVSLSGNQQHPQQYDSLVGQADLVTP